MANEIKPQLKQVALALPHSTGTRRGEPYIRFHLIPQTTAMLPIKQLSEVLNISLRQVVPIPHMPAWVAGVYNWRGEILWTVDLGHLLGLTPLAQQAINRLSYLMLVLRVSPREGTNGPKPDSNLGLIVNRVEGIEWSEPNSIHPPPLAGTQLKLQPFLQGYWVNEQGEMLVVLDGNAIVANLPNPSSS